VTRGGREISLSLAFDMSRRNLRNSRAVVTGASSGIGRAIARELARAGARLVLVARRRERLDELAAEITAAGGQAEPVVGDITERAVRQRALETAQSAWGGLDILVNNAGIGAVGLFEEANPERIRRIMEVNFFAPAELIRLALPLLENGNRPLIVNVGSILGHLAIPYSSEYCASKFALQGFSRSLRAELSRHAIDVLVVSPGTTQTEFFDVVIERGRTPAWPRHAAVPAEVVARKTVDAMRRGRRQIVPNRWGRLLLWLDRLAPGLVDRFMARYV